ncbi:MAG: hypothetical protein ACK44E_04665 [Anaerolineales bacterium]
MKSIGAGTTSSCLVWFLVFGLISMFLFPAASLVAGLSATLLAESVAQLMQPYLCPDGSTAEIVTSPTTMRSNGRDIPATNFEMQCVDASGKIVREPSPDYAFYWTGLLMAGSLLVSGALALLLAAPVGVLVARFTSRSRKANVV